MTTFNVVAGGRAQVLLDEQQKPAFISVVGGEKVYQDYKIQVSPASVPARESPKRRSSMANLP